MKLKYNKGLEVGEVIMRLLSMDNNTKLEHLELSVDTFANCRESGFVFTPRWFKINGKLVVIDNAMSYCVYEHRNSDSIIVNGKLNWKGLNGELPYLENSKHVYLAEFNSEEYVEVKDFLVNEWMKLILEIKSNRRDIEKY